MKKLLFALALLAGTTTVAHAQGPAFGLKAGGSLTNFVGDGTGTQNFKPGFVGGLVLAFPLSEKVSLRPELLFSQKGFQYNQIQGHPSLNLNYLDLPVLARYSSHPEGLFLELGPQVGWLLNTSASFYSSQNVSVAHPSFDLGYAGGIGYQLSSGLSFSLRYNGSVLPAYKVPDDPSYQQPTARNSAFQLTGTYMFSAK